MRRVRQGLAVALAAATLASEPTWAGGLVEEIKGGVLYHDVGGLWSGFRLEDEPIDINVEAVLSPSMPALWGVVRPAVGASINTGGDTSHVYLDARWQTEFASGLFFGLGLGAAVHDGKLDPSEPDRKALCSRALPHPGRDRPAPRRPQQRLGLLRAHLERQPCRVQRGHGPRRSEIRVQVLRLDAD